jgi:hypothetical protein
VKFARLQFVIGLRLLAGRLRSLAIGVLLFAGALRARR